MRIEQDRLGQIKNYIYIGCSAVLFLTWCLSVAALTQRGTSDGRLAWVLVLCFLTVPCMIYQSLTPIWSRTVRFSNPHAHCAVDAVLVLCWFSAWTSLTSYVVSGKGKGADDKTTGCANFAHGSTAKCTISEADIVMSVGMMLGFVATGWFSFRALMEVKRTGVVPGRAFGGISNDKAGESYPRAYKEDDDAFDSRLDVERDGGDQRGNGYSFEETRVHGGSVSASGHAGLGRGYETVPGGDNGYTGYEHGLAERPTSVGGPLAGNRL